VILLVGLGNPGTEYQANRHNIGFMVIDQLVDDLKAINVTKSSFKGALYKTPHFYLLKPFTYMNLSGESVQAVKNYFKLDDVIVFHDELDIPLGSIRIKNGGSSGGHNGLKSLDAHIGVDYDRVRLGIGRPDLKSDVTKHVLGNFSKEEMPCVQKVLERAVEIAKESKALDNKALIKKYVSKKSICE
jgi:PTH1 family peptidyl-tRNA hydrolase